MPEKEQEIAYSSNVVCIMNFAAFTDVGDILSLAQEDGFCLTGMHTIRIHKEHVNDMYPSGLCDKDFSSIRSKVFKLFCHGPSIALSLHRNRARLTLNSTFGNLHEIYGKNLDIRNAIMCHCFFQNASFYLSISICQIIG